MNYYRGQEGAPFHLSVGAVVLNEDREVCCRHYRQNEQGVRGDLYLLMRETVEQGETIEEALLRGCIEELGLKVSVKDFIGSIISHFPFKGETIEKTTLYFLCDSKEEAKENPGGWEASGKLEWHDPSFLIEQSRKQAEHFARDDYDESTVLQRVLTSLTT